jgi:Leucine-rich repeat (LRR) protein
MILVTKNRSVNTLQQLIIYLVQYFISTIFLLNWISSIHKDFNNHRINYYFSNFRLFLYALQAFIILSITSADNTCRWNTFNKLQNKIEILDCKAQTIDKHFLNKENGIEDNNILKELDIQIDLTKIEAKSFNSAIKMEILRLNNNFIVQLEENSFNGLVSLKELYLNKNQIRHLHNNLFVELSKLEILNLQGNKLTVFDFGTLEKNLHLIHLKLGLNSIINIVTTSFELPKLIELGLEKNILGSLSFQDLPILPNLGYLFIDGNRLTELEFDEIKSKFKNLKAMNFVVNDWDCCYLVEMINNLKSQLPDLKIDTHINLPEPLNDTKKLQENTHCTKCAKPYDNLKQIKALEIKLNELSEKKVTSFFNCNTTSLILGFLVVIQMIGFYVYFILKKKKNDSEMERGNRY